MFGRHILQKRFYRDVLAIKTGKGVRPMNRNKIITQLVKLLEKQNLISEAERLKLLKAMKEG